MREFMFTVPGNPKPWKRAGQKSYGGRSWKFTQPQDQEFRDLIRTYAVKHLMEEAGLPPIERVRIGDYAGPVLLEIWAYRDGRQARKPWQDRTDWDNLGKMVGDALQKGHQKENPDPPVLFLDDKQIVDGVVHKRVDRQNPRLVIRVVHLSEVGYARAESK